MKTFNFLEVCPVCRSYNNLDLEVDDTIRIFSGSNFVCVCAECKSEFKVTVNLVAETALN